MANRLLWRFLCGRGGRITALLAWGLAVDAPPAGAGAGPDRVCGLSCGGVLTSRVADVCTVCVYTAVVISTLLLISRCTMTGVPQVPEMELRRGAGFAKSFWQKRGHF